MLFSHYIGVRAIFFLGGAEPFLPENFFDSAQLFRALTCKITLPNSPHPIIIRKNLEFRALHLARWNGIRFFIFWLLPEKFSFCPKIMVLPESGGCSPTPWLIRLWSAANEYWHIAI